MTRSEGETTNLLRSTMDLNLDEVNAKLIEAGEKAVDAATLSKRRHKIRAKDSTKRKSPKPAAQPRTGTFASFVYGLPYDMKVEEVMTRAKAAGIMHGQETQVYKVRSRYPKSTKSTKSTKSAKSAKSVQPVKLSPIAAPETLRQQDAQTPLAQQLGKELSVPGLNGANSGSTTTQVGLLLMRLGMETVLREYHRATELLEAAAGDGKSE